MTQLRKVHEETIQAQYQEIESQRVFFTLEIEALKKEVREMKRTEEEDMPGPKTREGNTKEPSKSK